MQIILVGLIYATAKLIHRQIKEFLKKKKEERETQEAIERFNKFQSNLKKSRRIIKNGQVKGAVK